MRFTRFEDITCIERERSRSTLLFEVVKSLDGSRYLVFI